ncbi:helix-turn-helix domain-containing protein [Chloroflexota bacterium]
MSCPKCHNTEVQNKDGFTAQGSQRYRCKNCGTRYTPEPRGGGYSEEIRLQAVRMYADGAGFRQVARQLKVSHVSVMNWVKAYAAQIPDAPMPAVVDDVEMDELYTFIESKKTESTF